MLLPLMAQNNTNSPYTRFGYGDLGERSFGAGPVSYTHLTLPTIYSV